MEEADLLADMVAIMRKGELAAWGSPLELKTQHASALKFTLLVEKDNVAAAKESIRNHFAGSMNQIEIDAGDAGNISVTVLNVQQNVKGEGVPVDTLSSFVAWLECEESGVMEYGFSNSSLEEVFLKITGGDTEVTQVQTNNEAATESSDLDELSPRPETINLTVFTPQLTISRQVLALVWQKLVSTWTGRRSIFSWIIFGIFVTISTILGVQFAHTPDKVPGLTIQVGFLTFILLNICGSVYGDRSEGLLYLMRTQGLMTSSYCLGIGLYALVLSLIYSIIMLALLYATPMFREPDVCKDPYGYCEGTFGKVPSVSTYGMISIPVMDEFEGQPVSMYAYSSPGGLGKLIGAGLVFSLTLPGASLASSYLPGNKFALVMIAFISLGATVLPLVFYFGSLSLPDDEILHNCVDTNVFNQELCYERLNSGIVDEAFLDCISLLQGNFGLCLPAYAGLLPQIGFFQMLSMTVLANIKFYSEPPGYAEQVFMPKVQSGDCSGTVCAVPFASKVYGRSAGWELLGGLVLIIIGIVGSYIFTFPVPFVLSLKHHVKDAIVTFWGKTKRVVTEDGEAENECELEEVDKERQIVGDIAAPLLCPSQSTSGPVISDHSAIPRDEIPPILMHNLRKEYPSFGRSPPKVALDCLDLHVQRGEVLGLLGQNGAGKTTALKILACAHDATSGLGLVAGYDVASERISVFERLGNCPQFDVIWPLLTVKEHLVFFAKLKSIPRDAIYSASQDIAMAVGLGDDSVFNRRAGALSGGMRRRLSIAISLIGAPRVFVLDEPTTGYVRLIR